MALLKKLIRGRSRALPVGRGVPFRRPIRGRPTPPISIDRPPLTPSLGGAKPVQEGPLPLPVNPADDIVSALPVGPSIPFIPPLDTNELPTASPLPVPPPPPLPIGEQVPFIQQLIPENLRRGPFGNDRDRFKRPPPSLPPGGGKPGLIQNVNASGGFGQPLVPGSGTPPPQTGLTAAELLELSDEELQRYIPKEFIGQGVGSTRKTYDFTPSPEEFRKRLQAEMNPDPNDPRAILSKERRYNLVDQSPAPTPRPIGVFDRPQPPISIGGPGGLIPPPDLGIPIQPQVPIPSEVRDKFGNVVAGPLGRTPARFAEYQKSPIRESYADFIARTGGLDEGKEDLVFAGGSPTFDERGEKFVPPPPPDPVPDPVTDPATDPTVTETTTDVTDQAQTIPTPPGSVDPIITTQTASEVVTDPLIRALYFGTPDQPGFFNQLQQAGANLIGQDVPLQLTAGLSDLEKIARQRALLDLGVADPYLAEAMGLVRGTTGFYDPRITEQFYNPFEDRVVQQTIEDITEDATKRDIAQRAQDIGRGGLSAFGSRARLTAGERQEALGRGLGEALAGIRAGGFSEAQRAGLDEFARQQQAQRAAAGDIRNIGTTLADLRSGEVGQLTGLGSVQRDIADTGFGRLFTRDVVQQQRPLDVIGRIGQMLPGYTQATSRIGTTYGMPSDPSALGLGAALGAYTSLAPQTGTAFANYGQTTGQS